MEVGAECVHVPMETNISWATTIIIADHSTQEAVLAGMQVIATDLLELNGVTKKLPAGHSMPILAPQLSSI